MSYSTAENNTTKNNIQNMSINSKEFTMAEFHNIYYQLIIIALDINFLEQYASYYLLSLLSF